ALVGFLRRFGQQEERNGGGHHQGVEQREHVADDDGQILGRVGAADAVDAPCGHAGVYLFSSQARVGQGSRHVHGSFVAFQGGYSHNSSPSPPSLPGVVYMTLSRLSALIVLGFLPTFVHAGSSNSLLDVRPDGSQLLVVNADNGTVTLVDLKTRKTVREVKVGEKPEGVSWIADSNVAAVTVYRD